MIPALPAVPLRSLTPFAPKQALSSARASPPWAGNLSALSCRLARHRARPPERVFLVEEGASVIIKGLTIRHGGGICSNGELLLVNTTVSITSPKELRPLPASRVAAVVASATTAPGCT